MQPRSTVQPLAIDEIRCPYQRAVAEGSLPIVALASSTASSLALGTLVLVGVDHHTAPVALRERFHHGGELLSMLDDLRALGLAEAVVLFTCNRFEVYATVGTHAGHKMGTEAIVDYLAARSGMGVAELSPSLYLADGRAAALHLMRVASGLESLVLGEPQILGQVSDALAYAQANGAVGTKLARLFTSAVHAGKRARTETAIGRHTLSISHAAVLLLKSSIDLTAARVVVVGAGEMAGLAVSALLAHGAARVDVVNRTYARAAALAERFGVNAALWEELPTLLVDCDAVIAATSSPTPLLRAADFIERASGRSIELIDLSVPRNIDDCCRGIAAARMHDVDALEAVVETHRAHRQREAAKVEALLEEELAAYLDWLHSRRVTPLISDLRRQANDLAEAEVEQTLRRLPNLDEASKALVAQMAHRNRRQIASRADDGVEIARQRVRFRTGRSTALRARRRIGGRRSIRNRSPRGRSKPCRLNPPRRAAARFASARAARRWRGGNRTTSATCCSSPIRVWRSTWS